MKRKKEEKKELSDTRYIKNPEVEFKDKASHVLNQSTSLKRGQIDGIGGEEK